MGGLGPEAEVEVVGGRVVLPSLGGGAIRRTVRSSFVGGLRKPVFRSRYVGSGGGLDGLDWLSHGGRTALPCVRDAKLHTTFFPSIST